MKSVGVHLASVLLLASVTITMAAKQTVISRANQPIRLLGQPTRLLASKAMTTVITYRTTIPTCSFTTSCAMTAGAVTACRRLRRELDIDAILPSKPQSVEVTAAPAEETFLPDLLSSTHEPRDVLVNGLLPGGNCGQAGGPFGVTIIYTRTVLSDVTCLNYVTHTNTFTLAGCTPAGLVYCDFNK